MMAFEDEEAGTSTPEPEKPGVNPTIDTEEQPFSRLTVDVGTSAYALARGYLKRGRLPDPDSVRTEEFINHFDYGYPAGASKPFDVHTALFPSPTRKDFHVVRIGVRARALEYERTRPSHIVLAVDLPGTAGAGPWLDLLKQALHSVVRGLDGKDRVSLVTSAGVVLSGVSGAEQQALRTAIDALDAEAPEKHLEVLKQGYVLAGQPTDGDALRHVLLCSLGLPGRQPVVAGDLWTQVRESLARGISLSTLVLGGPEGSDGLLERLAREGAGRSWYVTRQEEARRLSARELTGTSSGVVALDARMEVQFDPSVVSRYRLMGYEHASPGESTAPRGGSIQAGQSFTALYEVQLGAPTRALGRLRIHFKPPEGGESVPLTELLVPEGTGTEDGPPVASARLAWVAAAFAEKLEGSYWMRSLSWPQLHTLWAGLGPELRERREVTELGELIRKAERLDRRRPSSGGFASSPEYEE